MNVGDFRLMDRKVINALKEMPERNRFMKGLFSWVGFKTVEVPYSRVQRKAGKTKWKYWKMWNFGIEGIISFSTLPLRIWIYLGLVMFILALMYIIFIVLKKVIWGVDVPGYASLISLVLFLAE